MRLVPAGRVLEVATMGRCLGIEFHWETYRNIIDLRSIFDCFDIQNCVSYGGGKHISKQMIEKVIGGKCNGYPVVGLAGVAWGGE